MDGGRGFTGDIAGKDCGRWFNDRTGTPMAYSRLPLRFWFFTAFFMQSKISVRELAETLGLPYNAVFRLVCRLRRSMCLTASRDAELEGAVVEMDEVYVTAGLKGKRHLRRQPRRRGLKRRGRGTYAQDKPPILGVVERKGLVRLIPLTNVAARTILRHLHKAVDAENIEAIFTDDYPAYNALRSIGHHETVNRSLGEYTRGEAHTNTVEGEFSVFRPWIATFRGGSKENLHLYTGQYNFLRNNRNQNRIQRTLTILIPEAPKT